MNRSSQKKSKRYYTQESDLISQSNSSDSEQDDASSFMDEEKSNGNSEIPADEIRVRKFQDDSTGAQITEFSIELPKRMSSYENFVWSIEPLIEKIEEFFRSDGEANPSNKPSDIESENKFEPTNAIHFTGALLQSYLKFFQEDRKLTFRFEKPRSRGKPGKLHEQVLKPILSKFDKKIKNTNKCFQEFIMVCQDKFDPFSQYDEDVVINDLAKIIRNYEQIINDNESGHKTNFFDKLDNVEDILKLHKPKYNNKKKKDKDHDSAAENLALCRVKAGVLLKNMKSIDKSPQKNPGATNKPLSPADLTEAFGGEIELSYCSKPEGGRAPNPSEKELRELLISEYNEPSDESFLFKLLSTLTEKAPLKISLYTAVLLSVVFNQKASRIEDVTLADLSSFINLSNFIPFPATPALKLLNTGYLTAKCIDRLLSGEIESCTPKQAYSSATREFNKEIYCINVASANFCSKYVELYASQRMKVTTPTSAKLARYEGQLALLNKIFEFATTQLEGADGESTEPTKRGRKPLISQIETIANEIKRNTGAKKYAECEYLASLYEKIQKGIPISNIIKKNEKKSEPTVKSQSQNNVKKSSKLSSARQNELSGVAKNLKFSEEIKVIEEAPLRVVALDDDDLQNCEVKWARGKSQPQSDKKVAKKDKTTKNEVTQDKPQRSKTPKDEMSQTKVTENLMPIENEGQQDLMSHDKTPKKSVSKISKQMEIEFDRTRETMQIETEDNFYFNDSFDFPPKKPSVYKNFLSPSKFIGGFEPEEQIKMSREYQYFEDYLQSFEESKMNDVFKENEDLFTADPAIEEQLNKDEPKAEEPASKKDLKTRKIEKEFVRNMKGLLKKPMLEDAKNQLASLQNGQAKKKKEKLREQIQKTEEWLEQYNQKLVIETHSLDKVQDLIESISEIPLRVKEMEDLFEKQRVFELWRVRFDSLLKKDKKRKTKNTAGQTNMLTFEELEGILVEAVDLKIYDLCDEPRLEELRLKYKKIQSLIHMFEACPNDLTLMRKVSKELTETNIAFPAFADALRERIELNERVILLLETVISIEKLEEFTQSLGDKIDMLDPSLYAQLERKHEEGSNLRNMLPSLLKNRDVYDYEQISEISSAMSAIKSLKIEIPNHQVLNNVLLTFKWLLDLEKLVRDCSKSASRDLDLVAENSQASTAVFEEEFQPDEVVKFCTGSVLNAFKSRSVDKQMLDQLKSLLQEANGFQIVDKRIESLFQLLNQKVFEKEGDFIEERREGMNERIEIEDDEDDMAIEAEGEPDHFKNWNELYDRVVALNPEEFLRKKAEISLKDPTLKTSLMELKENLNTLLESYEKHLKGENGFEERVIFLRKLQEWLEWLFTADTWSKRIDENSQFSFNELKVFYLKGKIVEVPKSWALFKKIEEKFITADSLLAEFAQKFKLSDSKGNTQLGSQTKGSIRKQFEDNSHKTTVTEVKKFRNTFKKKLSFLYCDQEIADLDALIDEHSKWKLKMDTYSKNNGKRVLHAAIDTTTVLEDLPIIESELNQLKDDYFNLVLRDEQDEKALIGFEYQLKSYMLLKTVSSDSNVEDWKKILKYAHENPKVVDPTDNSALLCRLKAELELGKEQHEFVRMLKSLNQKPVESLTLPELNFFLSELRKSLIRIPEDEKFVEELVEKMENLSNQSKQLCDPTKKDSVIDFTNLLDQIKRAPIDLIEEEELLEGALNCAERIARTMSKSSSNIDMRSAEAILNDYKKCPVLITDAEKLLDRYEKSRGLYESLRAKLNNYEESKAADGDDSQLKEIQDGLNALKFDFDGSLVYMKAQLYSLRVKHLQKLASNQEGQASFKKNMEKDADCMEQLSERSQLLTPQAVKDLSKEGHDLKKALIGQQRDTAIMNQALFWVDNLSRRINDKIREINSVSSREALDRLPKLLLGFVDLTQSLNEKRATLPVSIPVEPPQKSITASISFAKAKETREEQIQRKEPHAEKEKIMEIQNKLDIMTKPKEQQTDVQKISEKNEKQLLENLQPGKLVLKIRDKLKENNQKSNTKKEKGSEEEDSGSKGKQRLGANELSPAAPKTETAKTEYSKPKAAQMIAETLQSSKTEPLIDAEKSMILANSIVNSFPILEQSKEKLSRFIGFLKDVFKLPNIYKKLTKNSFPSKMLSKLFVKSSSELSQLEKKMAEVRLSKDESSKDKLEVENEVYEANELKKKVKVQDDEKPVNLVGAVPIQSIAQQVQVEEVKEKPVEKVPENDLIKDAISLDSRPKEDVKALSSMDFEESSNQLPQAMAIIPQQIEEEVGFQMVEDKKQEPIVEQKQEPIEEKKQEPAVPDLNKYYFSQKPRQHSQMEFENTSNENSNSYSQSRMFSQISREPIKHSQVLVVNSMEEEIKDIKKDDSIVADERNDNLDIPQDVILKIFDGMLKAIGDESAPRIALYTCDPIQTVRTFPRIVPEGNNSLVIGGKMVYSKFEPYINRSAIESGDERGDILTGWVESSNSVHQEACERISMNFLQSNKVGVTKYGDCVKIFFMHEAQFNQKWVERFNFKKKKLQKNSFSTLHFLLMFQPAKFTSDLSLLKRIEPEVIAPYIEQGEDEMEDSNTQKEIPRSGCSTPEIEPYSQSISISQSKLESSFARLIEQKEAPQNEQPVLGFAMIGKKPVELRESPKPQQEKESKPIEKIEIEFPVVSEKLENGLDQADESKETKQNEEPALGFTMMQAAELREALEIQEESESKAIEAPESKVIDEAESEMIERLEDKMMEQPENNLPVVAQTKSDTNYGRFSETKEIKQIEPLDLGFTLFNSAELKEALMVPEETESNVQVEEEVKFPSADQSKIESGFARSFEPEVKRQNEQPDDGFMMMQAAELREALMIPEEPEEYLPGNTFADHKMEIEKEQPQQKVEAIEISLDTKKLLTQPLANVMQEEEDDEERDNEPVIIKSLDPRLRRGMQEPSKPEKFWGPTSVTFKTGMDRQLKENTVIPQNSKVVSSIITPLNTQMEEEEVKFAPRNQFETQRVKPKNYTYPDVDVAAQNQEIDAFEQNLFQNQGRKGNTHNKFVEEPEKKLSEKMVSSNQPQGMTEKSQEVKNISTHLQINKRIPYDPEDDVIMTMIAKPVDLKADKKTIPQTGNTRVPLILSATQNKPAQVMPERGIPKNIKGQYDIEEQYNYEEKQMNVAQKDGMSQSNNQTSKKMFSSNHYSYQFSCSEDDQLPNTVAPAPTKGQQPENNRITDNTMKSMQPDQLNYAEKNQAANNFSNNTVKSQYYPGKSQNNANPKANINSYQYNYSEENQLPVTQPPKNVIKTQNQPSNIQKNENPGNSLPVKPNQFVSYQENQPTNIPPKVIPKGPNQFVPNQAKAVPTQNMNSNQSINVRGIQPSQNPPVGVKRIQNQGMEYQENSYTNKPLPTKQLSPPELVQKQQVTSLQNQPNKGQNQPNKGQNQQGNNLYDMDIENVANKIDPKQSIVLEENAMMANDPSTFVPKVLNQLGTIQNKGMVSQNNQFRNPSQYTYSETNPSVATIPQKMTSKGSNQYGANQNSTPIAQNSNTDQAMYPEDSSQPSMKPIAKVPNQLENNQNNGALQPKLNVSQPKQNYNQLIYSEESQKNLAQKNVVKGPTQPPSNQNNMAIKQNPNPDQPTYTNESQIANKPPINATKAQNQFVNNQANGNPKPVPKITNGNQPNQSQWKPQNSMNNSIPTGGNYSQYQESQFEDQNYEEEYPYEDGMEDEQEFPNNEGYDQYSQYNQPKFGGNYQRGNQNFKPQTGGQYNNRNTGYQNPRYDNRSNFNGGGYNNYNQGGSNFQGNRYNSNPRYDKFNNQNNGNFSNYNPRFSSQQGNDRPPQFTARPQQNFNNQRQQVNTTYRQNAYQNPQNYSNQQGNANFNAGYEQQRDFPNQNFQNKNTNFKGNAMPMNNRAFNDDGYGAGNGAQPNRQPTGTATTTSAVTNTNSGNNLQQGAAPKKAFAENSIFGKARINLMNALGSTINNSNPQTNDTKQ